MTPKVISWEGVGEEVCKLLDRVRRHNNADPVVLDFDMLRPLMMHWIHGRLTSWLIVDEHLCWSGELQVDVFEQLTDLHDILDSIETPPAMMMKTPVAGCRVSLSLPISESLL